MWPFLRGIRYTNSRSVWSAVKLTGKVSNLFNHFSQVRAIHEELARSDAQRRTIYALSTPPGKAGIAVVRISGPDALLVWKRMVKTYQDKQVTPKPWKLERCHIIHPDEGAELLDDGLAVYFKGELTHHL
jgi:tRNA modification GTPase